MFGYMLASMSRVSVQMLHFPTVPRGEVTFSGCADEQLWSACYVGLSLAFINLRIFWFFFML